jgi:hypothetical protein
MAKQVRSDYDFGSVARILGLPPATANGQPVTYEQLTAQIEGMAWKDDVRVATQGNLNLAAPGANVSGVAMAAGDRVLVRAQNLPAENGIYVWNGAAVAMTRAADASASDELEAAIVTIDEGVDAGTTWRQTQVNFVMGTGAIIWTPFGTGTPAATETVSGAMEVATQAETDGGADDTRAVTPLKLQNWTGRQKRFDSLIGDGTATQFDVSHNLGTRAVHVTVYRNAAPWDDIDCDVERPDANTLRLRFAAGAAPTANQFSVHIST